MNFRRFFSTLRWPLRASWAQFISNVNSRAKFLCSVCGSYTEHFVPLPDSYHEAMSRYGFPYPLESFETLNVSAYACPRCGSSDRDRICALYLKSELSCWEPTAKRLFVDFAPSQPLSKLIQS